MNQEVIQRSRSEENIDFSQRKQLFSTKSLRLIFKKMSLVLFFGALLTLPAFGQSRGAPIFQDSFETKDTFAENWIPEGQSVIPGKGKLLFPNSGWLNMRRNTPLEFCAEVDITVNGYNKKAQSVFCGFIIENFRFMILPSGITWMIGKGKVKQIQIMDFSFNNPVRLSLIRKIDKGIATYFFSVNGKHAGHFTTKIPVLNPKTNFYKPLGIFSSNMKIEIYNFGLFTVRNSADDSPNLVINSSFEYEQDGFPLYHCRFPFFNFSKSKEISYESFLGTWSLDTTEKHSGKQSLKIVKDDSTIYQQLFAWGAGTVKNKPGVFSIWMKADQNDFPVTIAYGKGKQVKVGKQWKRYEVVNEKLPQPSTYSPVTIALQKNGTLWLDDLQAELLTAVDPVKLKVGHSFATPYKPAELDKQRFCKQESPVRTPEIIVKKLPKGVVPNGNLDVWKKYATKVDKFYNGLVAPQNKTEAYFACNDQNFYVGVRAYTKNLSEVNTRKAKHDTFDDARDATELLIDPLLSGKAYQFFALPGGSRMDGNPNSGRAWNGNWTSRVKLNKKEKSIDTEFTIPFSTFANPALKSRWLMSVHRYDPSAGETPVIIKSRTPSFLAHKYWPYVQFPVDVMRKYTIGAMAGACTDSRDGTTILFDMLNSTGKDISVKAELINMQNNVKISGIQNITLKKGPSYLSFATKNKTNKVQLKLTKNGNPVADQIMMLKKSSPLTMLGRLSFYMNEKEAQFMVKTTIANPEKLTALLTLGKTIVQQPAFGKFKIALPLANVSDGMHEVKLALMKGNKKVAESTHKLIKRPYWKGATQINHFSRSVIHKGKPIVPFAPFFNIGKHQKKEFYVGVIDWHVRYGFKSILLLVENNAIDTGAEILDYVNKKGLSVLLWTELIDTSDSKIAEVIKKLNYPNIISQLVMDEPELRISSDKALAFLRKMRPLFPYHPTQMNSTVLAIDKRYANLETDILMLDDYLTNQENRTVESVVKQADAMWKVGATEGKPCYFFLAGSNFPLHSREPSYAEQIAQTYGSIAAGCTGFSYFYGDIRTPGNWKALLQLNKEILSLTDVICSEEETAQSQADGNPKLLRYITKKHEGFVYVIVCNIDRNPTGKVMFTLPGEFKYANSAEVLFENRKVPVKDGKFTDVFPAHFRHVYKVKIK